MRKDLQEFLLYTDHDIKRHKTSFAMDLDKNLSNSSFKTTNYKFFDELQKKIDNKIVSRCVFYVKTLRAEPNLMQQQKSASTSKWNVPNVVLKLMTFLNLKLMKNDALEKLVKSLVFPLNGSQKRFIFKTKVKVKSQIHIKRIKTP